MIGPSQGANDTASLPRKVGHEAPRWREVRDEAKYNDLVAFGQRLPQLRRHLTRDLALPGLHRDKVLATVVSVMERTAVRVGNDRYVADNGSFGLTTLLDRHAHIGRDHVSFSFKGKGGKPYRAKVADRRLASIVKRCRDIPGQRLFQYVDGAGNYQPISSSDVNGYLRRVTGIDVTAKTFRTWTATLLAARQFAGLTLEKSQVAGDLGGQRRRRRAQGSMNWSLQKNDADGSHDAVGTTLQ